MKSPKEPLPPEQASYDDDHTRKKNLMQTQEKLGGQGMLNMFKVEMHRIAYWNLIIIYDSKPITYSFMCLQLIFCTPAEHLRIE
jgi:hypothetical protein